MMRYEIPFLEYTRYAKNKGMIPEHLSTYGRNGVVEWVVVDAADDTAAYAAVIKYFKNKDTRPISGKSYVRNWRAVDVRLNDGLAPLDKLPRFKVGDRVILHVAHAGHRLGRIDEVLSDVRYGIALDDYPNIADFTIREFALVG